eukprot:2587801-Rhodomonas_salina.1
MALLMKAGHDVRLKAGSPQDPEDGGCIYLADGGMTYGDCHWRLMPIQRPRLSRSNSTRLSITKCLSCPLSCQRQS